MRDVAVLSSTSSGSTQLASTRPAAEVVSLLNEFFLVVVDTSIARRLVNKFQGDEALSVGEPIEHTDASGEALARVRELHDELITRSWAKPDCGIGGPQARAIAGHIGAKTGALRATPHGDDGDSGHRGGGLTDARQAGAGPRTGIGDRPVSGALDAEALCWDVGEMSNSVAATAPTQLAREGT